MNGMRLLRSRKKTEVAEIARTYAHRRGLPFSEPTFVNRTGLRRWKVTTAGQYKGGRSQFKIHDRSGEVEDVKVAC